MHIEITHSLVTDSFIQALRRVIARRGNIKTLFFSDNRRNFIGYENELKKAYMKKWKIRKSSHLCKVKAETG